MTASIADGQSYNLFDFGGQTGDFGSVSLTGSIVGTLLLTGADTWTGENIGGYNFSFSEVSGILSVSAVPEPSAWATLAGAAVLAGAALRRRRKA